MYLKGRHLGFIAVALLSLAGLAVASFARHSWATSPKASGSIGNSRSTVNRLLSRTDAIKEHVNSGLPSGISANEMPQNKGVFEWIQEKVRGKDEHGLTVGPWEPSGLGAPMYKYPMDRRDVLRALDVPTLDFLPEGVRPGSSK
jgi:hypothetical protein